MASNVAASQSQEPNFMQQPDAERSAFAANALKCVASQSEINKRHVKINTISNRKGQFRDIWWGLKVSRVMKTLAKMKLSLGARARKALLDQPLLPLPLARPLLRPVTWHKRRWTDVDPGGISQNWVGMSGLRIWAPGVEWPQVLNEGWVFFPQTVLPLGFPILFWEVSASFQVVVSGSPDVCLHLSTKSQLYQSGWWCPALWMFFFTCLPVWLVVCGSLDVCFQLSRSSYLSPWWCQALWISVFTCLPSFVSHAV